MAPPNPKPRRLTPCDRHPNIPTTTGLCAPCLRDRLSLLQPSTSSAASGLPELRRCKSFSANNCPGSSFEPRRRSCDVRARNSLSTLFDHDDDDGDGDAKVVESRNLGLLSEGRCPVPEVREEDEFRVSDFEESKTMKEFIDLELQASTKGGSSNIRRDFREIAGSFWGAASVFSKKLRKWRKKQGSRRENECDGDGNGVGLGEMRLEDLRGRRLRDTQSEVGEYGFGRRSCDMDPRGSLDLGRVSIDCGGLGRRSCDTDPRFSIDLGRSSTGCGRVSVDEAARSSFDAPRASWDGYLLGGRAALPYGTAPMVSVIENAMATVYGFDNRVLVEGKPKMENVDERDSHSSRSNLIKDQSNSSIKRDMVVTEDRVSRVSPAAIGIFNGTKLLITEKELNEWRLNSNSLKDDSSESFETASKDLASVSSSSNGGKGKKCSQWSKLWSIWGLLHRRKGDKCGNEEKLERENEASHDVDSTDNTLRSGNGDCKLVRSHSTPSSRGSSVVVGSVRGTESKAFVRRRQEDVVMERNRSARYSPNHLDNGLLRFYLTPLRSRRRNRLGKSRLKNSKSLARSVTER